MPKCWNKTSNITWLSFMLFSCWVVWESGYWCWYHRSLGVLTSIDKKFRNMGADDKKQDMKRWLKIHIYMIFCSYNYRWRYFEPIMMSHLIFVNCKLFVGTWLVMGWIGVFVLSLIHLCALVFCTFCMVELLPLYIFWYTKSAWFQTGFTFDEF